MVGPVRRILTAKRSGWFVAVFALLAVRAAARPATARAATVTGAAIKQQGNAVELHFAVHGHGLGWHLSIHKQELWIDLDHVHMQLASLPLRGRAIAPVASVRTIYGGGTTGRIVVEVKGRTDYAIGRLPHELVLRVAPAGEVPNLAAPILTRMEHRHYVARRTPILPSARTAIPAAPGAKPQSPVLASIRPPVRTREPTGHPLVVIDAGHGGYDPGTEAAGTVAEKSVALQIAMRLRSALTASGINVRMTRDSDTFLTLAARTKLANHDHADLFVSIHLNSSPDSNTTGIETYYLNNTTDRATIRLARMENGVAGGYGAPGEPNLNYILTDLRQQYKANESASLARMIEAETVADIEASTGLKVNELGAKQGPFYVLVGALMPSVLVECGFLSNSGEAHLLQEPRYQRGLADGIARAIVHYFNADAAVGNL
jgi:N-acetylmuramoyl-L-alanine amidase